MSFISIIQDLCAPLNALQAKIIGETHRLHRNFV